MKKHQIAGLIGVLFIIADLIYSTKIAFRISRIDSSSVISELLIVLFKETFMGAPGIILLSRKYLTKKLSLFSWAYPIILGLGLLNVYTADNAIGAGVPMIIFVFPFCLIFSVFVLNSPKS